MEIASGDNIKEDILPNKTNLAENFQSYFNNAGMDEVQEKKRNDKVDNYTEEKLSTGISVPIECKMIDEIDRDIHASTLDDVSAKTNIINLFSFNIYHVKLYHKLCKIC